MHQIVDACEQQPTAASEAPDEGVLELARIELMPGDPSRRPFHESLAPRERGSQLAHAGRLAGDTGFDRRRLAWPAPRSREHRSKRQPFAGGDRMAHRLGDVPVRWRCLFVEDGGVGMAQQSVEVLRHGGMLDRQSNGRSKS